MGYWDLYFSSRNENGCRSMHESLLCTLFPVPSLNSLLISEWLFSEGAPIVCFNLCPTVHWKPLFTYSATDVSVRVREYVWSARSALIQLKTYKNIQQRAPLENTVMQIASSDDFPALDKEDPDSPKVSSTRTTEDNEHHKSW